MAWNNHDKGERTPSPILPLKKLLLLGRYFGFPLRPVDLLADDIEEQQSQPPMTTFTFSTISYAALMFIGILIIGGFFLFLAMITYWKAPPSFMIAQMVKLGASTTEGISMYVSFFPSTCGFAGYAYLMRKMKSPLNEFCYEYTHLHKDLLITKDKLRSIYNRLAKFMIVITTVTLASVIVFQVSWTSLRPEFFSDGQWYFIMSLLAVLNLGTLVGIVPIICQCLIHQCMLALKLAFEGFHCKTNDSETHSKYALDQAGRLCKLLDIINNLLGPAILFDFTLTLYTLVFNAFYTFLTFTAFQGEYRSDLVLYSGIAMFLWGFYNVTKLSLYIKSGSNLSTQMKKLKKFLQTYEINNAFILGYYDKTRVGILTESCSRSAAIQPLDTFDLSYSTGVGIIAWLITNIIVLVQFRGGE